MTGHKLEISVWSEDEADRSEAAMHDCSTQEEKKAFRKLEAWENKNCWEGVGRKQTRSGEGSEWKPCQPVLACVASSGQLVWSVLG